MPYSPTTGILKTCGVCGQEKDTSEFPKRPGRKFKHGVLGHCWNCHRTSHRENHTRWRAKNLDKVAGYKLKSRYGITPEQYDEMLDRQGGVCAICYCPPSPRKKLGVDHNHHNGQVRELLCDHCNKGLGDFGDDTELLFRAIAYLGGE